MDDDIEEVPTWGMTMKTMRDPNVLDEDALGSLERWYDGNNQDPKEKPEVNAADDYGWSFIFTCAFYGKPLCLAQLLLWGADSDLRLTATHRSPLDVAIEENRKSCVRVLKAAGDQAKLSEWVRKGKMASASTSAAHHTVTPKKKRVTKRAAAVAARLAGPEEDFETSMKKLFKKYDEDGSGSIGTDELQSMFEKMKLSISKKEAEALVLKYDADKSGQIGESEFLSLAADAKFGEEAFLDQVKEYFLKNDTNNSNDIDANEITSAFETLQINLPREEIDSLIEYHDVDGNGSLDLGEFTALCKHAKEGFVMTDDDDSLEGGSWTRKEDDLFFRSMKVHGTDWRKAASLVRSKTAVQCRAHHKALEQRLQKTGDIQEDKASNHSNLVNTLGDAKDHEKATRGERSAAQDAQDAARREEDETRRLVRRVDTIHEYVQMSQKEVHGKKFDPETVGSWETQNGFRRYLRLYNVSIGTTRPASPKTRGKLRKVFEKDKKMYYGRLKSLRKTLWANLAGNAFTCLPVWRLEPSRGVEAKGPIGNPTQSEVVDVLCQYGVGKEWEKHIIPGTAKAKDPWGSPWDLSYAQMKVTQYRDRLNEPDPDMNLF